MKTSIEQTCFIDFKPTWSIVSSCSLLLTSPLRIYPSIPPLWHMCYDMQCFKNSFTEIWQNTCVTCERTHVCKHTSGRSRSRSMAIAEWMLVCFADEQEWNKKYHPSLIGALWCLMLRMVMKNFHHLSVTILKAFCLFYDQDIVSVFPPLPHQPHPLVCQISGSIAES